MGGCVMTCWGDCQLRNNLQSSGNESGLHQSLLKTEGDDHVRGSVANSTQNPVPPNPPHSQCHSLFDLPELILLRPLGRLQRLVLAAQTLFQTARDECLTRVESNAKLRTACTAGPGNHS
jgi:hypothetical protein